MRKLNSLKNQKLRHKDCQIVRRGKKILVINKTERRYNARQG